MLLIHLLALAAIGCAFVTSWLAWYSPEMDEIIKYITLPMVVVYYFGVLVLYDNYCGENRERDTGTVHYPPFLRMTIDTFINNCKGVVEIEWEGVVQPEKSLWD
jgi:hypothetical protein